MSAPVMGITTINNLTPELQLHFSDKFLSTPQFNLIFSLGADVHVSDAHVGRTTRMRRYNPLDTDGGQLDGSGLDPAPEVVSFADVDADTEIYAKSIIVNEQISLFENDRVLNKFTMLLGQWLRNKEDLLMRDMLGSAASLVNCRGGTNGDVPTNLSLADVDDIESVLSGADAHTLLQMVDGADKFGTAPVRDAFLALSHTDLQKDWRQVTGWVDKAKYGYPEGLMQEEYGSVSRFRVFTSSRGIVDVDASLNGNDVYKVPMYGVEAFAKLEQSRYTARVGYLGPQYVSLVEQNAAMWGKFAIARAISNQSWIVLLCATLSRTAVL